MKPGRAITAGIQSRYGRDLTELAIELDRHYPEQIPSEWRWLIEGIGKYDYDARFPAFPSMGTRGRPWPGF